SAVKLEFERVGLQLKNGGRCCVDVDRELQAVPGRKMSQNDRVGNGYRNRRVHHVEPAGLGGVEPVEDVVPCEDSRCEGGNAGLGLCNALEKRQAVIIVRMQVAVTEANVGGVVELVNFERAPRDEDVFRNDIHQLPGQADKRIDCAREE